MIQGLNHAAYRCRDSAQTRAFYEDFLGLELAHSLPIGQTKTGREVAVLHTFYRMGDGSFIAFFEDQTRPFDFKPQHDFDLHIALTVDQDTLLAQKERSSNSAWRYVAFPITASFTRFTFETRMAMLSNFVSLINRSLAKKRMLANCSMNGKKTSQWLLFNASKQLEYFF